ARTRTIKMPPTFLLSHNATQRKNGGYDSEAPTPAPNRIRVPSYLSPRFGTSVTMHGIFV
ncbi:hypothetical protein OF83DRAFT_1117141, partial [Amylostereum chailletii]